PARQNERPAVLASSRISKHPVVARSKGARGDPIGPRRLRRHRSLPGNQLRQARQSLGDITTSDGDERKQSLSRPAKTSEDALMCIEPFRPLFPLATIDTLWAP